MVSPWVVALQLCSRAGKIWLLFRAPLATVKFWVVQISQSGSDPEDIRKVFRKGLKMSSLRVGTFLNTSYISEVEGCLLVSPNREIGFGSVAMRCDAKLCVPAARTDFDSWCFNLRWDPTMITMIITIITVSAGSGALRRPPSLNSKGNGAPDPAQRSGRSRSCATLHGQILRAAPYQSPTSRVVVCRLVSSCVVVCRCVS